ncbi:RNA polymerase sigma factor [Vibrio sp. WXL103]|uniref:RNA polymerase sigma factor n=1 Tax=Vibrio sp. WXL103 TaxID=3450710 RepID=UPI003EC710CB
MDYSLSSSQCIKEEPSQAKSQTRGLATFGRRRECASQSEQAKPATAEDPEQAQLIKASCQGDTKAFSQLACRHQGYLRAFIAGRCNCPQDVDDLAQDTLILAYQKLASLEDPNAFRGWLSSIAVNLIRNHQRKQQRLQVEQPDRISQLLQQRQAQESESADISLSALQGCTRKLDIDLQTLLRAHYTEGLSIKELCTRFSLRHSTITMRLYRCRQWLKECVIEQINGAKR